MYYVSISADAIEKIRKHASKNPDKEVIGLLIGRMEGYTLIIEDSITGDIISERTRAALLPEAIAKIADEIISGKIKGNVIGWYHSHPGFGVFMSEIDIKTQMKMQQFSPYIVALILDPTKDEIGFFTVDLNTHTPVMLSEDFIHIYSHGEEPLPPKFRRPSPPQLYFPTTYPPITSRRPTEITKRRFNRRKMLMTTLIPILCLAIFGSYLLYTFRYPTVKADFHPPSYDKMFYGDTMRLSAKISGGFPPYNCTWYVNRVLKEQKIINRTGEILTFNYTADTLGKVSIVFNVSDKKSRDFKEIFLNVLPNTYIDLQIEQTQYKWGEIAIKGNLKGFLNGKFSGLPDKNVTLRFIIQSREAGKNEVIENVTKTTSVLGNFSHIWKTPQKEVNVNVTAEFLGDRNFSPCTSWKNIVITKREARLTLNKDQPPQITGRLIDETTEGVSNANLTITFYQNEKLVKQEKIKTDIAGFFSINISKFSDLKAANYTVMAEFKGDDKYYGSNCIIYIFPDFKVEEFTIKEIKLDEKQIIFGVKIVNTGFFDDNVNITLGNPVNDTKFSKQLSISQPLTEYFVWNIKDIVGKYEIQCVVISNNTNKKESRKISVEIRK